VNNLNLEIFIYLPNILVTVELYGLQVYITIKNHEKDRRTSVSPVFTLKLRPWELHTLLDSMSDTVVTNHNENFLLVNDKDSNILLFSTKTNLMSLSNVETIFVNGTFKSCPSLFTQIFTVYSLQNYK
jgi:hypothetical protein